MLIENAILVDSAFHSAAFFVVGNSCIIQGVFAFQKAVKKTIAIKSSMQAIPEVYGR